MAKFPSLSLTSILICRIPLGFLLSFVTKYLFKNLLGVRQKSSISQGGVKQWEKIEMLSVYTSGNVNFCCVSH